MRFLAACFLLVVIGACGVDESHVINVSPSAEPHIENILQAVDRLNSMLGEPRFVVRSVDSADRRDNEIVIRGGVLTGHRTGSTNYTHRGIVITLDVDATARTVAHELGHAQGLEHVDEKRNLMYRKRQDNAPWSLTYEQVEELRNN